MSVINQATLYLLATPLGNLGDASPRLLEVLSNCDVIAAEDTRVTAKLLAGLGIQGKRTVSVRAHNEKAAALALLKKHAGGTIAYLSDAGTPGISDPGAVLVNVLHEHGFRIVPVPGPSAAAAAFSVAGFTAAGFVCAGFLPRAAKAWTTRLDELAAVGLPVIIFEAPTRIAATMHRLATHLGNDVAVCLCRELTKLHEQIVHAPAGQLTDMLANKEIPARGEFTLVVQAPAPTSPVKLEAQRVSELLAHELPATKAAKLAAKLTGANARDLYDHLVQINQR